MQSPWLTRSVTGLLAVLALPSCLAFRYEEQEVHLRHDAEADRLEIAIVYSGVHGPASGYKYERRVDGAGALIEAGADPGASSSGLEGAARLVADMGTGRRYFLFYDWPFVVDLDSRKIREPLELPGEEALRQAVVGFGEAVRVDRSALFVDDEGGLGIAQHWVVPELSSGVKIVNDWINNALVANRATFLSSSAEGDDGSFADLSMATRERWVKRAEAGEPWIAATRGGFELSLPLSSTEFARALASIITEGGAAEGEGDAREFYVPFARALTEITHQDDVLVARFLPTDEGWISFDFEREHWEADGALLKLLRERDASIQALSVDQARALARGE